MTFEEAYELLNQLRTDEVAMEMDNWHPAILGEMLKAVAAAKRLRYPWYHEDYAEGAARVAESVGNPPLKTPERSLLPGNRPFVSLRGYLRAGW